MSYSVLNDPVSLEDARCFYKGRVVAKFCNMGIVSSDKWFPCYLTIYDGILRLYDDEETVTRNPNNIVLQMVLDNKKRPSNWKIKDYSKVDNKVINFYTFYVLKDNLFSKAFMYKRKLKFGTLDMDECEKLIRCIEFNTQNKATDVMKK